MKGIIDEQGHLTVIINGRIIKKCCPYNPTYRCGIWCALFRERGNYRGTFYIDICDSVILKFDEGLEVQC